MHLESVPAIEAIRRKTMGTPFERNLFVVGGAVRDDLLGAPHAPDFDLVTTLSSMELADLLAELSAIPPVTYPRFGTAMLKIAGSDVELVTARRENYDVNSRKPSVSAASLEEDAFRRDFTVNSLMVSVHTGSILDLTGKGLQDLEDRVLRTPLDPEHTFREDPLRMLRAVRFRWRLNFEPAPKLYEAIRSSKDRLAIVSAERIRDEFIKILLNPSAPDALDELMQLDLLDLITPEFRPMVGCEQGKYHHLDVWLHSLLVLRNAWSSDLVLNLAALLHDVGKPATRTVDERGNTRFFGHEEVGRAMTETILRRLKFPQRQIDEVALLVKNHMRLGSSPTFTATAARRLLRDMDGQTDRLLDLVDADVNGLKPGVAKINLPAIRSRLEDVKKVTPATRLVSPLSGDEIMILAGVEPGPEVGRLKALLTEQVLEGVLDPEDRDRAKSLIRDWTRR